MGLRTKIYDWIWWNIGFWLWKQAARNHPSTEVERRLGWMHLDCRENDRRWRNTSEGRAWLIKQAHEKLVREGEEDK